MSAAKSKSNTPVINPLETGREALHSLAKPTKKWLADEGTQNGKTFLEQLLGLNLDSKHKPTHADKHEQEKPVIDNGAIEIFNFLLHKQKSSEKPQAHAEKKTHAEAAIDYHRDIVKSSERASKSELREMDGNIRQIKDELAKLVASSQELKLQFADVGVDTSTPTVGKYQETFFEWMLNVIRAARQKVEDSGAWLNVVKGKRSGKAKTDYSVANGQMHQSGERTTIMNSAG